MATTEMNCLAGGGIVLNPDAVKVGYIATSGGGGTAVTYTIDTSKTYIVCVSANYTNTSARLMNSYMVENGTVSAIDDSSSASTSVTVESGTTLKINASSVALSYQIIQLD